jgi:N-acyl-phosphatidylethanolamine-hydrolysing phospholipase D
MLWLVTARFEERATRPQRGPLDIIRWRLLGKGGPGGRPAAPDFHAPRRENDGQTIRSLAASLTWVGHASFVLKLGGQLVAIDPVWSERLSGVVPRLSQPGVALEAIPQIDVALVTHNHYDHLDIPSLRRIGPNALGITPIGNGYLLRKAGMERIIELDWWQSHRVGDLEITLVPARHWSMRQPWNRNDMLWGGYVLRAPEGVAYHAGDTALFDDFREIGKRAGPIDWAMLPIGAYEPRWFMEPQHMNPEDAMQAFDLLGARAFVAMHWGTFRLTDEHPGEPPERMRAAWAKSALSSERLWMMDVGETRALLPSNGAPR